MKQLFTSEAVSIGHPDHVCDMISDSVLDACLAQDPDSRVACETMAKDDFVVLSGEITTKANINVEQIAKDTIKRIGYTYVPRVLNLISKQSPDIAQGVDVGGAGKDFYLRVFHQAAYTVAFAHVVEDFMFCIGSEYYGHVFNSGCPQGVHLVVGQGVESCHFAFVLEPVGSLAIGGKYDETVAFGHKYVAKFQKALDASVEFSVRKQYS